MAFTITKMITLPTSCVSKETADWLNAEALKNAEAYKFFNDDPRHMGSCIHGGSHYYGWIVYAHDDGHEDYPEDLVAVFDWVRKEHAGVDYINFDCEGGPIEHEDYPLPIFDW